MVVFMLYLFIAAIVLYPMVALVVWTLCDVRFCLVAIWGLEVLDRVKRGVM